MTLCLPYFTATEYLIKHYLYLQCSDTVGYVATTVKAYDLQNATTAILTLI